MCIKLVGLFPETLVCVIVNDPLVLFITFLMYPVLPTGARCVRKKKRKKNTIFFFFFGRT